MQRFILGILIISCFLGCNKTKKVKEKLFPERPYEAAKIDKFYWADSGWDYTVIPLKKPYYLQQLQGQKQWTLDTHILNPKIESFHGKNIVLNFFTPVEEFNIKGKILYGRQGENLLFDEKERLPQIWFIINTETHDVKGFEKEEEFKAELKKLNLPEKFLTPDDVFEQYKNDPVLPWFPEDIKKQLEEVKAKKKNTIMEN